MDSAFRFHYKARAIHDQTGINNFVPENDNVFECFFHNMIWTFENTNIHFRKKTKQKQSVLLS